VQKGTDGTSSLFFQLGCVTSSYSKNFCWKGRTFGLLEMVRQHTWLEDRFHKCFQMQQKRRVLCTTAKRKTTLKNTTAFSWYIEFKLTYKVTARTFLPHLANKQTYKLTNSMVWVRGQTIWTEWLLQIKGATWSAWRIPMAVFSVFETGAATFLSSSSSVVLTRLSAPTTFFFGSAGNRTQASGSVAKNSDH
jgi:hypothetical protein